MPLAAASVSLSRAGMAAVHRRLEAYHVRYAPFSGRREPRGYAHTYVQGLLSDEPRESIECNSWNGRA